MRDAREIVTRYSVERARMGIAQKRVRGDVPGSYSVSKTHDCRCTWSSRLHAARSDIVPRFRIQAAQLQLQDSHCRWLARTQ